MATRFVSIDSSELFAFLESYGFYKSTGNDREVIYAQSYDSNVNLIVKIYTSVSSGKMAARDLGEDAIRVTAVNAATNKGIYKGARVYRTGSQAKVHARILERIQEAFNRCGEYNATIRKEKPVVSATVSPPKPREFNLREEVQLRLKVVECNERDTVRGIRYVFTMKSDADQTFVYWSGYSDRLLVDEIYDVKGVVYGFNTFRGVKQITLSDLNGKRVIR